VGRHTERHRGLHLGDTPPVPERLDRRLAESRDPPRQGRQGTAYPDRAAVTLGDRRPPIVVEEGLEPGDHLLLYTDGIIEARSPTGEQFGVDRLIDFAIKAIANQLPLPETTRRLVHAILNYQDDRLQDDATVLLVQWRSPAPLHSDTELVTGEIRKPLTARE
jgi:hypothetical protein